MVIMIIIMIVRDYLLRYEKEIRPVPLHVSLQNQQNVQRLLPVNYVSINSTVDAHPECFRQHSPQWKKLRSQAHLTGSTAYNAMGFRGFSQLCNHFREFIHKKPPVPVDDATQA